MESGQGRAARSWEQRDPETKFDIKRPRPQAGAWHDRAGKELRNQPAQLPHLQKRRQAQGGLWVVFEATKPELRPLRSVRAEPHTPPAHRTHESSPLSHTALFRSTGANNVPPNNDTHVQRLLRFQTHERPHTETCSLSSLSTSKPVEFTIFPDLVSIVDT